MSVGSKASPVVIRFHRHAHAARAVLVDANLDLHDVNQLRNWKASGIDFVVIDDETGEDVTRVLLA